GNFRDDANTALSPGGSTGAYFFIDKIEVQNLNQVLVAAGNAVICSGNTDTLHASGSNTYAWADSLNPGTILSVDSFIVVAPAIYWVQASNICGTIADTIRISDHVLYVDLGNDTTLCKGETMLLQSSASIASYLWQDNSTNPEFQVTQEGTYWVEVTDDCIVA